MSVHKNNWQDEPTTELFVGNVLAVPCRRHNKNVDEPCYSLNKETGRGYIQGICNSRALKAGYNGKIADGSLSRGRKQFTKKPFNA